MQRLEDSAKILGVRKLPYTVDELCAAVKETIRANDLEEGYIRPLVYLGGTNSELNIDNYPPMVGIAVWEWKGFLGPEAREKGIKVHVSSFTRHHPNVMMTKAKVTGNYVNSVLAKTEAVRLGFAEAILLDSQGLVAECAGENLFTVRKGKLITPFRATVLEGITRDSVITIAKDLGIEVVEEPISRDQLYLSDEMFVTGSAAECLAITEVDFRVIGSGTMGPVTRRIQENYYNAVHGKYPRSKDWLDYVN
jgi:branched-chain amino acid aminotransferase